MAKKQLELSVQGKRRAKSVKHTKDSNIDFSDIPELTDRQLSSASRVGRPKSDSPKQLIAIRLSPELLSKLRNLAKRKKKPYQSLMHEILEKGVKAA